MPWKEATAMSLRTEFIQQAELKNANLSELCRRFGTSRKTGYKWLKRYREEGESGGAGSTPRASGLGRAENQSLSGTERAGALAQPQHDHRDPAAQRSDRSGRSPQTSSLPAF